MQQHGTPSCAGSEHFYAPFAGVHVDRPRMCSRAPHWKPMASSSARSIPRTPVPTL